MTSLSAELYWLIVTAIFTSLQWMPQIVQRILEMKPYAAFRDPYHDVTTQASWAQRSIRAHANSVANLVTFCAFVLVLEMTGTGNAVTAIAAKFYFISRVVHFVVYTLGVPWLRTPVYLFGLGCQLLIAWVVLNG